MPKPCSKPTNASHQLLRPSTARTERNALALILFIYLALSPCGLARGFVVTCACVRHTDERNCDVLICTVVGICATDPCTPELQGHSVAGPPRSGPCVTTFVLQPLAYVPSMIDAAPVTRLQAVLLQPFAYALTGRVFRQSCQLGSDAHLRSSA